MKRLLNILIATLMIGSIVAMVPVSAETTDSSENMSVTATSWDHDYDFGTNNTTVSDLETEGWTHESGGTSYWSDGGERIIGDAQQLSFIAPYSADEIEGRFQRYGSPNSYDELVVYLNYEDSNTWERLIFTKSDILHQESGSTSTQFATWANNEVVNIDIANRVLTTPGGTFDIPDPGGYDGRIGIGSGGNDGASGADVRFYNMSISEAESSSGGDGVTNFDVGSVATDEVTVGETTAVSADITNTGGSNGTQTVTFDVNGQQEATQDVTVTAGETKSVAFDWTPSSAQDYDLTIASENDSATISVSDAEFLVNQINYGEVTEGETTPVNVTLENPGDFAGTQTVTLDVNGSQVASQEVTVASGATETITLDWNVDQAGDYDLTASSENDTATTSVSDTTFNVVDVAVDTVLINEAIDVNATLENTGDFDGKQPVTLSVNGTQVDSQEVSITSGSQSTITFQWTPDTSGNHDLTVATENDSMTTTEEVIGENDPRYIHDNLQGSGTEADPYIITTVDELQSMKVDRDAHYMLGNDIDASPTQDWNNGSGFEPVASDSNPFTGHFDGNGHVIDGLYINRTDEHDVSLFGVTDKTTIEEVGLENVDIQGYIGGSYYTAGLVADAQDTTIRQSYLTGTVNGSYSGVVGAFIGSGSGNTVEYTWSTVSQSLNNGGGSIIESYKLESNVAYWDKNGSGTLTPEAITGTDARENLNFSWEENWVIQKGTYPGLTAFTTSNTSLGIELYPTSVSVDEEIVVDYTIENTGNTSTSEDIRFLVNGMEVDLETATLNPGESYSGTFTYGELSEGTYESTIESGEETETVTTDVSGDDGDAPEDGEDAESQNETDTGGIPITDDSSIWIVDILKGLVDTIVGFIERIIGLLTTPF